MSNTIATTPGFFRILSDLLFMVILTLVLVLILMVSQVKESQAEHASAATAAAIAAQDAQQAGRQAAQAQQDANQQREARQALEQQLAEGTPIDFVAVVDVSMSMSEAIADLKRALEQLAELLPRVTRFRLGVICYREGVIWELPLREVTLPKTDGGQSLREVEGFLAQVTAATGYAGIDRAVNRALSWLDAAGDGRSRQVLGVLADVGVGEMPHHGVGDGERLIERVDRWAGKAGSDRRLVSLYSGNPTSDPTGERRAFFERLGAVEGGALCTQSGQVFAALIEAIFSPNKE